MPAQEARQRLEFPVKGMHCAACVGRVERALAEPVRTERTRKRSR